MIVKNQYPICEFDTNKNPIIHPTNFLTENLPKKCVITYLRKELEHYWLDKGEEKMIADTSKNGTYSVTLDEGDNYLTLEGNDFCGSLQVVVE